MDGIEEKKDFMNRRKSQEKTLKRRIFEIIQIGNRSDIPSFAFDVFIAVIIILNIATTFIQTFEQAVPYSAILHQIEFFTIALFTIEYALRILTAEYLHPEESRGRATLHFIFSFYGIVDILTILPYFIPFFFPSGAVAFRMFRVVRIFHLFRINAQYDAFNVITNVIKEKKNQLLSSLFLIVVLLFASSLCMYSLEHEAQPEYFSNAFSGIWWSVSTLLTVGYGDIYPITVAGRLMGIVIAFLGVGMVAIPTGIISAGFVEYYTRLKTGLLTKHAADFITLDIPIGHSYVGKTVEEIELPKGLYAVVVLRGKKIHLVTEQLTLQAEDYLLLGSESHLHLEAGMEEVLLEQNHPWIGSRIQELDISRREYVTMIKRNHKNIPPEEDMVLKENDRVLIFSPKA